MNSGRGQRARLRKPTSCASGICRCRRASAAASTGTCSTTSGPATATDARAATMRTAASPRTTHYPGDTMHLSYAAGEYMLHSVENVGDTDLLFTTVEFLDSANAALPVPGRRAPCGGGLTPPSGSRSRAGDPSMYAPAGVKTAKNFPIPERMRAWVLGNPGELKLIEKPVPVPRAAEVLVRIDAVAICATDLDVIALRAAGAGARRPAASTRTGRRGTNTWAPSPRSGRASTSSPSASA